MARKKRASKVISKAETRKEGVAGIDPVFEVTAELTLADYTSLIAAAVAKQAALNLALGVTDALSNELDALLKELRAMSNRVIDAIAAKYGKDSSEFEKAGGKRSSDINHNKKKKVAIVPATTPS